MERFWVQFKTDERGSMGLPEFMNQFNIEPGESYLVLGAMGDKLLVRVGKNLVEVYPKYLTFVR